MKVVNEIKFERVWSELEEENCFQRQLLAGYLRLMGRVSKVAHGGKSLISVFQEIFGSINKVFVLAGRSAARLSFYGVLGLFWYFLIS